MRKKGFTLIEIIVVLAILGVLAMLVVPSVSGYLQKAKEQKAKSNARVVVQTTQIEYADQYLLGNLLYSKKLPSSEILDKIYEISNAKGNIQSITVDDRNDIEHLVYQEGDITVTYCRDYTTHSLHSSLYSISDFVNSQSSFWMKDKVTGQNVEVSTAGYYKDAVYPSNSKGHIVYYDGDNGEEGYYIIKNGDLNSANKIHNYIGKSYGWGGVVKLDTDGEIETYDYSINKKATTGKLYYVVLPWTGSNEPVLAYLKGYGGQGVGQGISAYHKDITRESEKSGWIILEGQ